MSLSMKIAYWNAKGLTVSRLTKALQLNHDMEIAKLRSEYAKLAGSTIKKGTDREYVKKLIDQAFELRKQIATNKPILQKGVRIKVAKIMGTKPTKLFHEFYSLNSKQALKGVKV